MQAKPAVANVALKHSLMCTKEALCVNDSAIQHAYRVRHAPAFRGLSHLRNHITGYWVYVCCSSNMAKLFEANFEEVVLFVLKMSKFCPYVVHIVLRFQLTGREVTSVHC